MILVYKKELECIHLSIYLLITLFVIVVPNSISFLFKNIFILIKIETKIEYNKIKSTRKYFELCLTV
jgi:hypothetical protein